MTRRQGALWVRCRKAYVAGLMANYDSTRNSYPGPLLNHEDERHAYACGRRDSDGKYHAPHTQLPLHVWTECLAIAQAPNAAERELYA